MGMGMPAYPSATPAYPSGGVNVTIGMPAYPSGGGFSLVKGNRQPAGAVHGHQNDANGTVYVAIAHTPQGEIPGKAKDGNCWYPFGGKEIQTRNFSWLNAPGARLVQSPTQPANAIQAGFQNNGFGSICPVIAHTPQGNIPGKAKGNTCWYPYGGQEHTTSNFSWICQ